MHKIISHNIIANKYFAAPIAPPQSMLLASVNATSVTLDLTSWQTSGCPISTFSVRYHVWGDEIWQLVNNNILPNTVSVMTFQVFLLSSDFRLYVCLRNVDIFMHN